MEKPYTYVYPKPVLDENIKNINKTRKENKVLFEKLINQYLNINLSKIFPKAFKKTQTLASKGWSFSSWITTDNELGWCYFNTGIKRIAFNRAFLNEVGEENTFKNVLRHEISHAVEFEVYGDSVDTNEGSNRLCETCAKIFGQEYYNDGLYETETDFSTLIHYHVVFEKYAGTENGYVALRYNFPEDYEKNPGYIYTTVIDLFDNKPIARRFFDSTCFKNEKDALKAKNEFFAKNPINKIKKNRIKISQPVLAESNNINFQKMFHINEILQK